MNNYVRIESLEQDELSFIQKRYAKESKAFIFGMNMFLIAAVAISFIVGLIYYIKFGRTDMMLQAFMYAICISLIFFSIICYFSYMKNLYDLKRDLKEQTKIVESTLIIEKKYMSLNNTYHFYLNNAFKYTIEVSQDDYNRFEVTDEINIEYSSYSKEYFGYF